jgi:hypothetical protein
MRIVIEATRIGERGVQRIFASMAKGRMAKVMSQAQRLGEVLIQAQGPRHRPPDLRDLQAVREADSIMIAVRRDKNLRLVAETAEGDRVDQSVAVALKDVPRPTRP